MASIETRSIPRIADLTVEAPLRRFHMVMATVALFVLTAGLHLHDGKALVVSAVVLAGFWSIAQHGLRTSYPHEALGLCNIVTAIRMGIVALLAGVIVQSEALAAHDWLIFALAALALSLDGVDGWLARRAALSSAFGARFDMETDAALGAVLATILLVSGKVGPEVLVLGFMRYGFVVAGILLPWLNAPLPDSFRRKAICVIQIVTLTLLLLPITPFAGALTLVAAALLVWSFAVDVLWLARHR